MTSGRAVRSIIQIPVLETRGEAGSDHLEEDRGSVTDPQDHCCEQKHGAKPNSAEHHSTRQPIRGLGPR